MTISVNSYKLRTADFNEEQLKALLSFSVGFNPRCVTMELPQGEYIKVKLEEKIMGAFVRPAESNEKIIADENVRYVTGQLVAWGGSKSSGHEMADRAAEVIRALVEKIKALENPVKE